MHIFLGAFWIMHGSSRLYQIYIFLAFSKINYEMVKIVHSILK